MTAKADAEKRAEEEKRRADAAAERIARLEALLQAAGLDADEAK